MIDRRMVIRPEGRAAHLIPIVPLWQAVPTRALLQSRERPQSCIARVDRVSGLGVCEPCLDRIRLSKNLRLQATANRT